MSVPKKNVEISLYTGGNETIDRLKGDDEEVWIVNAKEGRKVIILSLGSTSEEAWAEYERRFL